MIFVRGKWFRAVDVHDMLRLGHCHFAFSCKRKVWPKLFFGLVEITLVNIYIVAVNTNPDYADLTQEKFRWQFVEELIQKADKLDAAAQATARARATAAEHANEADNTAPAPTRVERVQTPLQIRLEGAGGKHHFDIQSEYVSADVAAKNQKVVDTNPCHRPTQRKGERRRDLGRRDGKVLNPFHTSLGACIVCKFFFNKDKPTKTMRYCRECKTDPQWPETTRAKGWQLQFQPRLCSKQCFDIFHTTRISGLDFRQVRRRKRARNQSSSASPSHTRPRYDV